MLCSIIQCLLKEHYSQQQEEYLINCLNNKRTEKNQEEEESIIGNIENFKFIIFPGKKIIIYGGFVKLMNGSNIFSLERKDIKPAILKLNQITGLPIHKSKLYGVDIAMNIFLEHPYKEYIPHLKETHNYIKNVNRYLGVSYRKGNSELVFYNKLNELRKKDPLTYNLIKQYNDENGYQGVMRIELRLRTELRKTLLPNIENLIVIHLLSEKVERKLIQLWYKHYNAITKTLSHQLSTNVSGYSDIRDVLATMQLQQQGLSSILTEVDQIARTNKWSSKKKCTVKRDLRDLHNYSISQTPIPHVLELDRKVSENEEMNKWKEDWRY